MRVIRRGNARPGVCAIRTQSRESRDPERGRLVKIGFLDTGRVNRMGRMKVKQSSAPGLETACIPLKNPEESGGKRKQEALKENHNQEAVVREQRKKKQNRQRGDKRFEGEGGMGVLQ